MGSGRRAMQRSGATSSSTSGRPGCSCGATPSRSARVPPLVLLPAGPGSDDRPRRRAVARRVGIGRCVGPPHRPRSGEHVSHICQRRRGLGPTYVTYIGVSGGASCTQAKKLVRSYYQCRVKHGGKFDEGKLGHCSGVEGFHCTESRYGVIKVQYDASVTCARGRETVRHNYTQFTYARRSAGRRRGLSSAGRSSTPVAIMASLTRLCSTHAPW